MNDGINDAQEKQQIALKHKITRGDIGTTRDARMGSHNRDGVKDNAHMALTHPGFLTKITRTSDGEGL